MNDHKQKPESKNETAAMGMTGIWSRLAGAVS